MLGGADQKALVDYWHDRVRLTNLTRLGAREPVTTQELRHECTNYDELRRLKAVQELDELERCRVIAIIKYECTAKVLQRRTGLLRDYARQCEEQALDHRQKEGGLLALITKLKDILKGKDGTILRLESRIKALQAENEVLRTEQQQSKAERQRDKELIALQRAYEAEVERRKQLAKTTRALVVVSPTPTATGASAMSCAKPSGSNGRPAKPCGGSWSNCAAVSSSGSAWLSEHHGPQVVPTSEKI
jgi:septal ring factor EnvC (AmiA/AmiB activator)